MVSTKGVDLSIQAVTLAYVACIVIGFRIAYQMSGGYASSLVVMGAMSQCLGIAFLCIQVSSTKVATGISAKSVALDALSLVLRLSNTVWLDAYIPRDPTGDFLYQSIEVLSVLMIAWLLHKVLVTYRDTYQATEDTINVMQVVMVCFVLAAILHANLAARPMFDILWMTGLFVGTVAVMPQFSLICKKGGRVDAFTSHYIIALAASRVINGIVMWLARHELTCEPWIEGVEHGKWAILVAHALQFFLVADFSYHYAAAAIRHGFCDTLELPMSGITDS